MRTIRRGQTLVVFLDVTPEKSIERIAKRGREMEKGISLEYLKTLHTFFSLENCFPLTRITTMSSSINIRELDRIELLKRMWTKTGSASFFMHNRLPSPAFPESGAEEAVSGYIDYFGGKPIKTDLSKDSIDPWLYNRDAGQGALEEIVEVMRKKFR